MSEQLKEQVLYNQNEFNIKNLIWVDRYVSGPEGVAGIYESRRMTFEKLLEAIEGNINIPTGESTFRNGLGATIHKGSICTIIDSNVLPIVSDFDTTNVVNAQSQLYVAKEDILDGQTGLFFKEGILTGIDTSGFTAGEVIFWNAGVLSNTQTNDSIFAGVIITQDVNGSIYFSPDKQYSVVKGNSGEVALFVGTNKIQSNSRFTFIDNEGTEVGFRFSDSAGNLTQAGVTYLNVESQGLASNSALRLANWADNANKGIISFRKSRGTKTLPTKVLANDILGHLIYAGQTSYGTGSTTAIVEVVAKTNYDIVDDGFGTFQRYGLTEFRIYLAPDTSYSTYAGGFSNNLAFSVDGNGLVKFLNYAFPIADGTPNQVLKTDGAGNLSWGSSSTGGVSGTGTANYLPLWTTSSQLGNSLIRQEQNCLYIGDTSDFVSKFYIGSQDEPTGLNVNVQQQDFTTAINFYSSGDYICNGIIGSVYSTGKSIGAKINSFSGGYDEAIGGQFKATAPNYRAIGVISEAINLGTGGSYCFQGIDGSEGVGKVLTCMNNEGMANWVDISSVTDYIPRMKGNEVFRGVTFQNNSTTITTYGGITNNLSGSQGANSVATTNYRTRQHTMRFEPSVVQTGQYCCMRSSAQLWSVTGGFYFVAEFGISDSNYSVGTHNFWGLCNSTSNLPIGTVSNSQPSVIPNIIAVANDSTDANLQIMHNDDIGNANKIDLGSAFPANRTSGSALTNMYLVEFYNAPSSTEVKYRVTNKETGNVAQGVLLSNLPNSTTLLAYQAGRSMGTTGGGISQTGRFDVSRLGVYSI